MTDNFSPYLINTIQNAKKGQDIKKSQALLRTLTKRIAVHFDNKSMKDYVNALEKNSMNRGDLEVLMACAIVIKPKDFSIQFPPMTFLQSCDPVLDRFDLEPGNIMRAWTKSNYSLRRYTNDGYFVMMMNLATEDMKLVQAICEFDSIPNASRLRMNEQLTTEIRSSILGIIKNREERTFFSIISDLC